MPFDHGDSAAVVSKVIVLYCSVMFKNKLLLNSPPLSDKITPGASNTAIQCLMKVSTISSFRLERTTAAVLKRVALSMICKNFVPLISFKSTEAVSLKSLDKKNPH